MKSFLYLRVKRYLPIYIVFACLILLDVYAKTTTVTLYDNMEIEKYFWQVNISFDNIRLTDNIISLILLISPYVFIQIAFGNILHYDTSINGCLLFTRYKSKNMYSALFIAELSIHLLFLAILTFLMEYIVLNFISYDFVLTHESWKLIMNNFAEIYISYICVAFITNLLTFILQDLIKASVIFNGLIICSLIFLDNIRDIFLFKIIPILTPIIYEENMLLISSIEIIIMIVATFLLIRKKEIYS